MTIKTKKITTNSAFDEATGYEWMASDVSLWIKNQKEASNA